MTDATTTGTTPAKRCFVTVGATAPFEGLIRAIFRPSFLQALHDAQYTELRVQYGKDGQKVYEECTKDLQNIARKGLGIEISGFGYDKNGLAIEMRTAKGGLAPNDNSNSRTEGAVVSHAGSGSILDAMRIGVPLIVVPNTALLHNHQTELAEELEKQEYVIYGKLDKLADAIPEVEQLRIRMRQWPPVNSGEEKYERGLKGIMDDEMGWVD